MNRRTLLTALLMGGFGSVPAVLAQSGKLRGYRVRLKTKSKSIIGTTIEARDQYEAVAKTSKRYPGSTILNLKPDRREAHQQRKSHR